VTDGKKMEGSCSTGQSPQWAVVPVEEEEEEEEEVGYAISELCCLKLEKKRGKTVHSILYLKQKSYRV
jgi:hypothetical protein